MERWGLDHYTDWGILMELPKKYRGVPRGLEKGRVFLVVQQHYWGKGEELEEAFRACVKAGGSLLASTPTIIMDADASVTVNGMGMVEWDAGKDNAHLLYDA